MLMEEPKGKETPRGEKATFVVNVQFRQNATWQGTVRWLNRDQTQRFRSTLELISLMEDALSRGGASDEPGRWRESADKTENG